MKSWGLVAAVVLASVLTGCGSMSGLDAQSSFSCKAPAGVSCQSISGTYANSVQDNLPFQQQRHGANTDQKPTEEKARAPLPPIERQAKLSPRDMDAMNSGMPIRQPPLVLRIWLAPFEDDAGDLHDQSYMYTMVHPGKWMIESNRTNISRQFRPVFPLKQKVAEDPKDTAPVDNSVPGPSYEGPRAYQQGEAPRAYPGEAPTERSSLAGSR